MAMFGDFATCLEEDILLATKIEELEDWLRPFLTIVTRSYFKGGLYHGLYCR